MTARLLIPGLAALLLAGCELAPPDKPTPVTTPLAFKEAEGWTQAQPADAIPRGSWWTVFKADELNGLEDKLSASNQNLKAAVARYDEARGLARQAAASLYPQLDAGARSANTQLSKDIANPLPHTRYQDSHVELDLNWEIDLFGRLRDMARAGKDRAEASAADLASLDLALHAELADDYFTLRGLDAQGAVLDDTVASYAKALDLTQSRFKAGYAAEPDVSSAQTLLELAKTQQADTRLARARLEHAIAVLTGAAPAEFSLKPQTLDLQPPGLAPTLPATLLQRRPDIAAAERRVFAANADIGQARAAYFPDLSLAGLLGTEATSAGRLFSAPASTWAIGPAVALNVFDGGRRRGLNEQARAAQAEAAANYRQTVLTAYGQVEDNLAAVSLLDQELRTQSAAVDAAKRSSGQALRRYSTGYAAYYDVITAQTLELSARLQAEQIRARRLTASVDLVRSLGGGWVDPRQTP